MTPGNKTNEINSLPMILVQKCYCGVTLCMQKLFPALENIPFPCTASGAVSASRHKLCVESDSICTSGYGCV